MKWLLPLPLLAACAAPVETPVDPAEPAAPVAPVAVTLSGPQAVATLDQICGDGSDRFLNFGQRLAIAQQSGELPETATATLVGGTCTLTFTPEGDAEALRTALSALGRPLDTTETGGVYIRPNDAVIIFTHDDPSEWALQTYRAV